jgi:hypothetical protein
MSSPGISRFASLLHELVQMMPGMIRTVFPSVSTTREPLDSSNDLFHEEEDQSDSESDSGSDGITITRRFRKQMASGQKKVDVVNVFRSLLPSPPHALLFVSSISVQKLPYSGSIYNDNTIVMTPADWVGILSVAPKSINSLIRGICEQFYQEQGINGEMALNEIIHRVLPKCSEEILEIYLAEPQYLKLALEEISTSRFLKALLRLTPEKIEEVETMDVTRFGYFDFAECTKIQEKFPASQEIFSRALQIVPQIDVMQFLLRMGAKVKLEALSVNISMDELLILLSDPSMRELKQDDLKIFLSAFKRGYNTEDERTFERITWKKCCYRGKLDINSLRRRQLCTDLLEKLITLPKETSVPLGDDCVICKQKIGFVSARCPNKDNDHIFCLRCYNFQKDICCICQNGKPCQLKNHLASFE